MAFCIPLPLQWRITLRRTTIAPNLNLSSRLPFTASALGQLPPRVLLQIISYFNLGARDRCLITSICSDLRNLALTETSLWTDIDLRYPEGVWWAKLCVQRSGSAPLRVQMRWPNEHCHLPHVAQLVQDAMLRMDTVSFEAGDDFDPSAVPEFSIETTPLLRSVMGYGAHYGWHSDQPQLNTWAPILLGTWSRLISLIFHGGNIQAFPFLPELKHLELTDSRVSLECLYTLLEAQTQLEILSISHIAPSEGSRHGIPALQGRTILPLPGMHTLRISGCFELVRALLAVMNNPTSTFEVSIRSNRPEYGCAPKLPRLSEAQFLVTRMMKFWRGRVGARPFPRARFIVHPSTELTELYNTVSFVTPRSVGARHTRPTSHPSLFFSFDGLLDGPLPFVELIDTMQIRFPHPMPFGSIFNNPQLLSANDLILPGTQWSLLANVDRLVIIGAGRLSRLDERENAQLFMSRESQKRRRGHPLTVEFNFCDPSLHSFGAKLVQEGVWSEIRWNHTV